MPEASLFEQEILQKSDLGKLVKISWRENPKNYVLESIKFYFEYQIVIDKIAHIGTEQSKKLLSIR